MPVPARSLLGSSGGGGMARRVESGEIVKAGIRIAVPLDNPNLQKNHLIHINKNDSLDTTVKDLCQLWNISNKPENYALKFENSKGDGNGDYIDEKSKLGLQDGTVICFSYSPMKICQDMIKEIERNESHETPDEQSIVRFLWVYEESKKLQPAVEFVKSSSGVSLLVRSLTNLSLTSAHFGALAGAIVATFANFAEHDILKANDDRLDDRLDAAFVQKLAQTLHKISEDIHSQKLNVLHIEDHCKILKHLLDILDYLVVNGKTIVQNEIKMESLVNCINTATLDIRSAGTNSTTEFHRALQNKTIKFLNTLFQNGDESSRSRLESAFLQSEAKKSISEYIAVGPKCGEDRSVSSESLKANLYALQMHLLNQIGDRLQMEVDRNDLENQSKLMYMTKTSLETVEIRERRLSTIELQKYGPKNLEDHFQEYVVPPGIVAFDLIHKFATEQRDQYAKFILENACRTDEHQCPFMKSAVNLVALICQCLKVGEEHFSNEVETNVIYPMFFAHDDMIFELFSVGILHLHKTWKDMRATTEDFEKVMEVVRESINISLKTNPNSREEFKTNLKSYNDIVEIRKEEAKHRAERECKPIQDLRDSLEAEVDELIQQQRLNVLVEGSRFPKLRPIGGTAVTKRDAIRNARAGFCKLSANQKALHYCEWLEEHSVPTIDNMRDKIAVSEIKALVIMDAAESSRQGRGKRDLKFKISSSRSQEGSQVQENSDLLEFVAPDQKTFDYWCDAINALTGNEMKSKEAEKDRKMLLDMEVKLRLLDLEGIEIPNEPPPIPPSPPNYDFCR